MHGVVITNAGPLIVLAKLNLLHLLVSLYGKVQVPLLSIKKLSWKEYNEVS